MIAGKKRTKSRNDCWNDTAHHDMGVWNKSEPKSKPNAAGLKMWRFETRKKCLETIAIAPIIAGTYSGRVGKVKSPIIRPETPAAPIGISFSFLNFCRAKSVIVQEKKAIMIVRIASFEGKRRSAVAAIRERIKNISIFGVNSCFIPMV